MPGSAPSGGMASRSNGHGGVDYAPRVRVERLIATGRVVLATFSLLAVWVDPSTAAQHRVITGFLRSEEHTSELQSPDHLVCRLLLEKKKKTGATCRS